MDSTRTMGLSKTIARGMPGKPPPDPKSIQGPEISAMLGSWRTERLSTRCLVTACGYSMEVKFSFSLDFKTKSRKSKSFRWMEEGREMPHWAREVPRISSGLFKCSTWNTSMGQSYQKYRGVSWTDPLDP